MLKRYVRAIQFFQAVSEFKRRCCNGCNLPNNCEWFDSPPSLSNYRRNNERVDLYYAKSVDGEGMVRNELCCYQGKAHRELVFNMWKWLYDLESTFYD